MDQCRPADLPHLLPSDPQMCSNTDQVSMYTDLQAPFTVSQMRKFADKLRNFSTTPTPESKPSAGGGHRHRRHSTLSASATHTPPAASTTLTALTSAVATPESSWAGSSLSPEFAPQRLLGQSGTTPAQGSARKGHASRHHHHRNKQSESSVAVATAADPAAPSSEPAAADTAVATLDAAGATAGLRQGSEGQMMLLPKGVGMNDLLALAEEMDPDCSPGKKGRQEKRMLTADSTMQLAAYLASKVGGGQPGLLLVGVSLCCLGGLLLHGMLVSAGPSLLLVFVGMFPSSHLVNWVRYRVGHSATPSNSNLTL